MNFESIKSKVGYSFVGLAFISCVYLGYQRRDNRGLDMPPPTPTSISDAALNLATATSLITDPRPDLSPETVYKPTDLASAIIPQEVIDQTPDLALMPVEWAIRGSEAKYFQEMQPNITGSDVVDLSNLLQFALSPENLIEIDGEYYVINAFGLYGLAENNNQANQMLVDVTRIIKELLKSNSNSSQIPSTFKTQQMLEAICSVNPELIGCNEIPKYNGLVVELLKDTFTRINESRMRGSLYREPQKTEPRDLNVWKYKFPA